MNIKYPYQTDYRGHTATSDDEQHIREMLEQVLFTSPGERVNRPSFGSGLLQLVFEPNSQELASTIQFLIHGNLQQWLGDLIDVSNIEIKNNDASIEISISYTIHRTQESHTAVFNRNI